MAPCERVCLLLAAGVLVLATGCSASSAAPASDAGVHPLSDATAPETGTDGAVAVDAADASDASEASDAATGDGSTGSYVILEQKVTSSGTVGSIGIALDPHSTSGLSCAHTTSGPCAIDDCTAVDAADGGVTVSANGGVVTLTGGNLGAPLKLSYGAGGRYTTPLIGSPLFDAGALFTVSAAGAEFPAFSGQSAPAPGAITITAPALTMGTFGPTYLFAPAAPLTWSWTGGSAGDSVTFTVINASVIITCSFDAAGGAGTIPQDVVARFPTAASTIEIVSLSSTTLAAGTDRVQFEIAASGATVYLASQ